MQLERLTRDSPVSTSPAFSILMRVVQAWERVIHRAAAMPSWVMSSGAPYSMFTSRLLNLARCSMMCWRVLNSYMHGCCPERK